MKIEPPPIRIGMNEWVVIRDNPRLPAAVIVRFRLSEDGREYFRVVSFDLDRTKRRLLVRYWKLEEANDAVKYKPGVPGPGIHPAVDNWA